MKILTNENKTFNLDNIGNELAHEVHYCVYDFSDKHNPDYFFKPLVMTETFNNVTVDFQIGEHKLMLPQEWSIILADPTIGEISLIPIDEINTREFHAFTYNPIKYGLHRYYPLKPVDIFTDISWTVPRLGPHNFLLVPLTNDDESDCIFILNEKEQRKIGNLELDMFI